MIGALARKFFGSANDRRIKGYQSRVNAINALEGELAKLSDEALKARTGEFTPPGINCCARLKSSSDRLITFLRIRGRSM